MTNRTKVALAALALTTFSSSAIAGGKEAFEAAKCGQCHGVKSQSIVAEKSGMGSDLSQAGTKHDAKFYEQYLKKEIDLDGKKHIKKFSGSDDELKVVIDWMMTLK